MSDEQERQDLERPVDRVTRAFLVLDGEHFITPLKRFVETVPSLESLVLDAIEGLAAVIAAASIPFTLTNERVQKARFQGLYTAERIRALKHVAAGEELTAELSNQIFNKVSADMRDFLGSAHGTGVIRDAVIGELDRAAQQPEGVLATQQLLSQALVATWSVMEVFSSSFVIASVNRDPTLARALLESPDLKKHFGKPALDLEAIEAIGYDLTASMGNLLFAGRRMDSLPIIRTLMEVVAPSNQVHEALHDDQMWMLNQRRHLIVHRRGFIDREYRDRTPDQAAVGSRLSVSATNIEDYLIRVRDAIAAILNSVIS